MIIEKRDDNEPFTVAIQMGGIMTLMGTFEIIAGGFRITETGLHMESHPETGYIGLMGDLEGDSVENNISVVISEEIFKKMVEVYNETNETP